MKQPSAIEATRRAFLAGAMPVCALALTGGGSAWASPYGGVPAEEKHKFDRDSEQKLTRSHVFKIRYGEFMQLAAALEKEWGREKLIEFLKKTTTERMLKYGQSQAKQAEKNDFQTYVGMFRGPRYDGLMTMEVVADTDTIFELNVTECIWAKTFLEAGLGYLGHAHVCFGDFAWASGFNPGITMVRDKTLMQGHACCNHRYVWEG